MDDTIKGFEIADPTEMLILIDEGLRKGRDELHKWQMDIHKDFAHESTDKNPYQAVLRTCNGAGKDRVIIAPCSTWLAMRYPYTTCVVTSASGTQLDRQTNAYIKQICEATNKLFGYEVWKINYRHYENNVTKSTIELFVTDESGRAEGWHPVVNNRQLAIFTSEAKSIPDEIFHALARCTGFTKRLDCSTPGLPMGHFFDRCTSGNWRKYHITAYDCPHLAREYIEQCRLDYGGETSSLFKSMVLAEFGSTDDLVVIQYHNIWRAINKPLVEHFKEPFNTAGLDLSAGGDETALAIRNGNKLLHVFGWRYDDTSKTVDHLEKLFKQYDLQHPQAFIYGDAGGLGKPILDTLKARGWHNIRFVLNQQTARNHRTYRNKGTEMWFDFARLVEQGEILLLSDERLKTQLATRYYKQTDGNKYALESKLQARAKGHPSPDRADAVVLAYSNYRSRIVEGVIDEKNLPLPPKPAAEVVAQDFLLKEHAKRVSEKDDMFRKYWNGTNVNQDQRDQLIEEIKQHNESRKLCLK